MIVPNLGPYESQRVKRKFCTNRLNDGFRLNARNVPESVTIAAAAAAAAAVCIDDIS